MNQSDFADLNSVTCPERRVGRKDRIRINFASCRGRKHSSTRRLSYICWIACRWHYTRSWLEKKVWKTTKYRVTWWRSDSGAWTTVDVREERNNPLPTDYAVWWWTVGLQRPWNSVKH